MVFSSTNGNIYVLGQLKDPIRGGAQRGDTDFFMYSTRAAGGGRWTVLNPAGVVRLVFIFPGLA
jgi:hypothetical protein